MDFWKRAQETGCSELTFILASIHVHALSMCVYVHVYVCWVVYIYVYVLCSPSTILGSI